MAGTDCGFSTFAGFGNVDENIVYKKLESLVIGTELASKIILFFTFKISKKAPKCPNKYISVFDLSLIHI